jgi:hypothetical protein
VSMRLRVAHHAAALALVVWYLMTPPLGHDSSGSAMVDGSVPLEKWKVAASYNSGTACQVAKAAFPSVVLDQQEENDHLALMPYEERKKAIQLAKTLTGLATCVAEGDPRLGK